ncbi:hypothetical protein [Mycobacterium canetti]|uniref:hypothetical protein n=1 Tax=Mycobacterium canetti TaxID=78331 RepID=UPI001E58CB25|nr:hypothetical protein [Mycobacterium canetti]
MSMIDRIVETARSRNREAFLVGVGSLMDLRGIATYEAMQDLMPNQALRPLSEIYDDTNRVMRETPTSPDSLRSSSHR